MVESGDCPVDDRDQIAGLIHDELMPYLFASAAALNSVGKCIEKPDAVSSDVSRQQLDQAAQWIDQARRIAQRLLNQLRDGVDESLSLGSDPIESARRFCESIRGIDDVAVQWPVDGEREAPSISDQVSTAIHFILVELVRNAWRHSQAKQINVRSHVTPQHWQVAVIDDGIGFSGIEAATVSTHGLTLLQRRADAAGIDMQWMEPDAGTHCQLTIPLN
ncbi:MAG: ATP-binding protein [Planctomycetota bacterium]